MQKKGGYQMKIIDFELKGNVVRFTLGADDCDDYWGDDWDDVPYEHNAGPVYDEFVTGYATIYFPFSYEVMAPESDWHYRQNSPFCKKDFKDRKAPCLVAVQRNSDFNCYEEHCYSIDALRNDSKKFYFGDKMEPGEYRFTGLVAVWDDQFNE